MNFRIFTYLYDCIDFFQKQTFEIVKFLEYHNPP